MTESIELVLLIGDFHIPHRVATIPECFQELLKTDKIRHVLCTGNIGSTSTLSMLRGISGSVHVVRGDMDVAMGIGNELPESKVVKIGDVTVGLIHGHQALPWGDISALSIWQRKLDCDVLVSGHTHRNHVQEDMGRFYINPGSVTGARQQWSERAADAGGGPACPSFMLMAITGVKIALYVYEEREGRTNVVMSEFKKGLPASSLLSSPAPPPPPTPPPPPPTGTSTSAGGGDGDAIENHQSQAKEVEGHQTQPGTMKSEEREVSQSLVSNTEQSQEKVTVDTAGPQPSDASPSPSQLTRQPPPPQRQSSPSSTQPNNEEAEA